MRMRSRLPLILLVTFLLAACAALAPSAKDRKEALDDFMYALRWQRYQEASTFFTNAHRDAFLDQMDQHKGLNVTDVRLARIALQEEGRRAEALLEMDYYMLPSATLKTLRIKQSWVYFEAVDGEPGGFLITTPFPAFP